MMSEEFLNLSKKLQEHWVQVLFTKKDGTEREMICTTNLSLIPDKFHPKAKPETKTDETPDVFQVDEVKKPKVYKVFEKDKGWRSFGEDQIISVNSDD